MADFASNPSQSATPSAVEMAQALVATPSVNPVLDAAGTGEKAAAHLTAGWLRDWGFDVELIGPADRPSVVGRLERGEGRSLILSGHLDTVGVAGMTIEPFEPEIRDGRLWGRGSADMKGGVAAALAAARDLADSEFAGTLILALTADEEEAAMGCQALIGAGLRADAAIVCEPTSLAVMPAHKGFAWIRVEFSGRAAHGSRPDRGIDAIRHAGRFLARLDEMEGTLTRRAKHPLLGSGSIHAGTIEGGTAPSVYPSSCHLTLERRTLPGETLASVRAEIEFLLAQLRSDVPAVNASVEVTMFRAGTEIGQDHELVRLVAGSLEACGTEPRVAGMTAWVEAAFYNKAGIPSLCFGPGSIEDAHTAAESVQNEEIERAYLVLRNAARTFLS